MANNSSKIKFSGFSPRIHPQYLTFRMAISRSMRGISAILATIGIIFSLTEIVRSQIPPASCSPSALTRFIKHRATLGETLNQIAQNYNLLPSTIKAMNPRLGNGQISAGREILIPPYDGFIIEVRPGQTWREIAKRYKVRPDVLFELHGCQEPKDMAFIPTAKMKTSRDRNRFLTSVNSDSTPRLFPQYPLAVNKSTTITLAYGWQNHPRNGEVFFHSGVDLLADIGTSVQAVAEGVVAYAQEQGSYGKLVIINHADGLQTRYAHLDSISVQLGQSVQAGDELGKVGTTGEPASKKPHLHFEVRANSELGWAAREPQSYFPN